MANGQPTLLRLELQYSLCGQYLLNLHCDNVLSQQLSIDIDQARGGYALTQLRWLHSIAEYQSRAALGIQALGGCPTFNQACNDWQSQRGSNLMR